MFQVEVGNPQKISFRMMTVHYSVEKLGPCFDGAYNQALSMLIIR